MAPFGRKTAPSQVYLNVYDLSPANDYLYSVGLGLHHSGVEISGIEYSFASGAGIFESSPREAPNARFRQQINMGSVVGKEVVQDALSDLRNSDFGPDDYHLIRNNCNHFANRFIWKLLNKTIPSHVNRLADVGVCCSCLLPRQMLEHAPVGDTTGGAASGGSRAVSASSSAPKAFTGGGSRLGGSTQESTGLLSSWKSSSSSNKDDLTDRREKARQAALARLEQQRTSPSQ